VAPAQAAAAAAAAGGGANWAENEAMTQDRGQIESKDAFVQALDSVSVTSSCGIFRSRLSLFLIADFQLTFG
jgi:hypothetical protein